MNPEFPFHPADMEQRLSLIAWKAQIIAQERDACALLAHNKALHCDEHDDYYGRNAALDIEDAIRAQEKK